MHERLITEAEAIAIEQNGGIAPLDETTWERLLANGVRPETASRKVKVVYQVNINRGRQKAGVKR